MPSPVSLAIVFNSLTCQDTQDFLSWTVILSIAHLWVCTQPLSIQGFSSKECTSHSSRDTCPMPCCKQYSDISLNGSGVCVCYQILKLLLTSCHPRRENCLQSTSTSLPGWWEQLQMGLLSSHLDTWAVCPSWRLHLRMCMTL